jgi:hypothetical protein
MTSQQLEPTNNQKPKAERPPLLADSGGIAPIVPRDIEQAFRLATVIAQAQMAPRSYGNDPNKILVGIMHGMEVGLTPMAALQSVAVINGMPALYGDGVLAVVYRSGLVEEFEEYFEGEGDKLTAICRTTRRGQKPVVRTFSVADAKRANLLNKPGPWREYPTRMLRMRARSFALRDAYADVLRGLKLAEEVADIPMERTAPNRYEPANRMAEIAIEAPPEQAMIAHQPAPEDEPQLPPVEPEDESQDGGDPFAGDGQGERWTLTTADGEVNEYAPAQWVRECHDLLHGERDNARLETLWEVNVVARTDLSDANREYLRKVYEATKAGHARAAEKGARKGATQQSSLSV